MTTVVVVSSRVCAQLNVMKAPPVAAAPRKTMPAIADPEIGGQDLASRRAGPGSPRRPQPRLLAEQGSDHTGDPYVTTAPVPLNERPTRPRQSGLATFRARPRSFGQ